MNTYFYVDGSSLLADIHRLRSKHKEYAGKKFSLKRMVSYFTGMDLSQYHGRSWRRFTFYFVDGDPRVKKELELPDPRKPGAVEDLSVVACGKRVTTHAKASKWLDDHNAPGYVRDCFHKAEKAVDTQICCDALQLAAQKRLDRLFLYSNDLDFLPLCATLKSFGANINLIRIIPDRVNKKLVEACDGFNDMPIDAIDRAFGVSRK